MTLSPRIGVVIVTMGTRPRELEALLASVAKQDVPAARVVLVGNATSLDDVSTDVLGAAGAPGATEVTKVPLAENLGCPGGRNVGLELLRDGGGDEVDVVVELDDDGLLIATDVFREVRRQFAEDPRLGIIGFRVADEQGRTERRWVPRLRAGDPMRGGPVTAFLGGGHAFSMPMLRQIGLWPGSSSSATRSRTSRGGRWTAGGRSVTCRRSSSSILGRRRPGTPSTTGSPRGTGCGSRAGGSRRR